jgi:outer membrane protein TolC
MKRIMVILMMMILQDLFSQDIASKMVIDIDTAVKLALANNLDIKSEKLKFENTKWSAFTSWNKFIPVMNMGLSITHLDPNSSTVKYPQLVTDDGLKSIPTGLPAALPDNIYSYVIKPSVPENVLGFNFNMTLTVNASLFFGIYQNILDYQSGNINLESTKNSIVNGVKKSFYGIYLMQNLVEIMKDNLSILEKRRDEAAYNFKIGMKSEYDYLSAESDYENAKPELAGKENELEKSLGLFRHLLGLKKDADLSIDAKFDDERIVPDADSLISEFLPDNLNLKSLKINMLTSENLRNMYISAMTPSFSFGYAIDPYFSGDPLKDNWFGDRTYMNDHWKLKTGALTFSMSVPLEPLFPFSQTQVDLIKAQNTASIMKLNIRKTSENIGIQVESLVNDIRKLQESIVSYEASLALTQKAYDRALKAYEDGTLELLDVQTQENKLEIARFNLLNSRFSCMSAVFDLENILNAKLDKGGMK